VIGDAAKGLGDYRVLSENFIPPASTSDAPLPPVVAKPWKALTTGGSTGRPKVILDHRRGEMDPAAPPLRMIANDTILNSSPAYHTAPFCQTAWCMASGGHVVETAKFEPLQTLTLIERHRVRWLYLVPTMMHRILQLPASTREGFDLSSLDLVAYMAAPCPAWLKRN
jgi:bile acid-coenzyme A ligase